MNPKNFIVTFLMLASFLVIFLSGCLQIQQMVASDGSTPATVSNIKIGVIQPSGYFTSFNHGAELARTQINYGGGVLEMPVEFIVMDNQGEREFPDAAESIRIVRALIEEEGVDAILGPIFSTTSMEVGPIVQQLGRPMIPASTGQNVTSTGNFIFLAASPTSLQGAMMAKFAVDVSELDTTTAATIRQADDVFSENVARF